MSSINKQSQNLCYNFIFKETVYIIVAVVLKRSIQWAGSASIL